MTPDLAVILEFLAGPGLEAIDLHAWTEVRDMEARGVARVTRRAKRLRLPCTPAELSAPLHSKPVVPMDVPAILRRMLPHVRERFQTVWELAFPAVQDVTFRAESRLPPSMAPREHLVQLCADHIVERADGPGPLRNVALETFEDKDGGRLRFLLWTADFNELLKTQGYTAHVDLQHISHYLGAVHTAVASARDLTAGFYQIAIPRHARPLYRFQDASGGWWQMTRLPMGLSVSVELCHTLTSTLAGHRDFALPEMAVPESVLVHTWIDNVRYAGSSAEVARWTSRLDIVARQLGATFKPSDNIDCQQVYDFLGVRWDHSVHKVSPGARITRKIRDFTEQVRVTGVATVSELESGAARLLHAGYISGTLAGSFYFSIKFVRRLLNKLNRGLCTLGDVVHIPDGVRRGLVEWADKVQVPRFPPHTGDVRSSPHYTLFTDASKSGWGGVLVKHASGQLQIVGESWPAVMRDQPINRLEAAAVLHCVRRFLSVLTSSVLHIVIDNTSVLGVARKGKGKEAVMNASVVAVLTLLMQQKCAVSFRYIKSADNPSDVPSRVPLSRLSPCNFHQVTCAVVSYLDSGRTCGVVEDGGSRSKSPTHHFACADTA